MCLTPTRHEDAPSSPSSTSSETNERDNRRIYVASEADRNWECEREMENDTSFEEKCEAWHKFVHGPEAEAETQAAGNENENENENENNPTKNSRKAKNKKSLLTKWGEELRVERGVHQEYPRPCMVRNDAKDWVCLNGFWKYAVKKIEKGLPPRSFDGDILVPFPVESALSGVAKRVTKEDFLWYKRTFSLPANFCKNTSRLLLHFGAVDWQTIVYINGQAVGDHSGGYDPFEFDITRFLNFSGAAEQEVVVRVYDPTDDGIQPRGKQCSDPFTSNKVVAPLGMWYTPNSGIWQSVWLECVPKESYIQKVRIIPNIDTKTITVTSIVRQEIFKRNNGIFVKVFASGELVGFASGSTHHPVEVKLNADHKTRLWSPDTPFLYDVEVYLHNSIITKNYDNHIDMIRSYTAMRKVSVGPDVNGVVRLKLNNKNLFQYGTLDQGWWPDGLYAPASEEALKWDIQVMKNMGFNMIRKHVKVESQRWYYNCDKIGMLVWQDMPNGSLPAKWSPCGETDYSENPTDPLFAKIFEDELLACVDALYNHPCIAVWVPFNEAWGQYNSIEVVSWLEHYDKTRLVWLSGGNDFGVGSAIDRHVYPEPEMPPLDSRRVAVLGEFGGLGHALEEHSWNVPSTSSPAESSSSTCSSDEDGEVVDDLYATFVEWGYGQSSNLDSLAEEYLKMLDKLRELALSGLSAAVYTQFSDVERESNGLVTYDRRVVKLDALLMRKAHKRLLTCASLILSRSHMDLVSLVQESMAKIPRSATFSFLPSLHDLTLSDSEDKESSSESDKEEIASELNIEEQKFRNVPRSTSLTSVYICS
jgi:hypothetical protein